MHILGDIGNTDTKLFLVSTKNKIIKKITFLSKNLNQKNYVNILVYLNLITKKLIKFYFVVLCQNLLI